MDLKQDLLPLLRETWDEFQKDEAGQLGAALSYYAVFSLFPLLIIVLAIVGKILGNEQVQAQILAVVRDNFNSPELIGMLKGVLERAASQANAAGVIGLVTFLLGASGVFQQLNMTFNKIWDVPKKPPPPGIINTIKVTVIEKLFSFGMVLAVSFLLLISLVLTGLTQALLYGAGALLGLGGGSGFVEISGFIVGLIVTLALNTLIFALLFKYLPDTRVSWGDVWIGALATAAIWEIAKRLLAIYIGRSSYTSAYGAVGTMLVLMAWIFFSSQILFLGAEFTQVFARRRGSRAHTPATAAAAVGR